MTTWRWLSVASALAIHDRQLATHGGSAGVRDIALLESDLARPQNLNAYGSPDVAELAASYAFGIARNHPFVDGNKRTAFVSAITFMIDNSARLIFIETEVVLTIQRLAAGEMSEAELASWFRQNTPTGLHEEAEGFIPATKPRRRTRRARS